MTHAWCTDVSRDAAVRAAEDNRTGPLPTLGECIKRQNQSQTARPCGGTDPATLGGEPSVAGNGLRTERITLEVTHDSHLSLRDWPSLRTFFGETVRVVGDEEREGELATCSVLREACRERADERDTAKALAEYRKDMMDHYVRRIAFWTEQYELRESALKKEEARVGHLEDANRALMDAANTASDMIDKVEAERDAAIRERDAAKARVAHLEDENRALKDAAAPTANGDGEGEPVADAKPFAWAVVEKGKDAAWCYAFRSDRDQAQREFSASDFSYFPVYRSPPKPRGWLSEEERACLEKMRDELKRLLLAMSLKTVIGQNTERDFIAVESILARSSPPEVVKPGPWTVAPDFLAFGVNWQQFVNDYNENRDAQWIAVLAAAGVPVKESP
jgi:hypothetical protein